MHGGMHISRNSQIHSIGLLICSRALSDPAVQSYELRIQQSGYSQILIGNESVPKTRYELVQPLAPYNQRKSSSTKPSGTTAVHRADPAQTRQPDNGDAHVTPQPAQKLQPNLRTLQRNHLPLVCCGQNAKNELFGRVYWTPVAKSG